MTDRLISRRGFIIGGGAFVAGLALDQVLSKNTIIQFTPRAEDPIIVGSRKDLKPDVAPVVFIFSEQKEISEDQFIQQFNLILDKSIELGDGPIGKKFNDQTELERFVWFVDDNDIAIALSKYRLKSKSGPNGLEEFNSPKTELSVKIDQHQPRQLFENVTVQTSFEAQFLEGLPASFSNFRFDFSEGAPDFKDEPSFQPTGEDLWKLAKRITEAFNWSVQNKKTLRLG